MEKLVSIIVPVYNVEKYLNKCLDSILMQTYKNIEIILINDESTDNSGEICDTYSLKDSRIKAIHSKKCGVSSIRNLGLEMAKGEYIAFIDSDDLPQENMIERLVQNLEVNDCDISICGYSIFKDVCENKIKQSDNTDDSRTMTSSEALAAIFNSNKINGFLWNKLFRQEIIKGYRFELNLEVCEDLYLVCQILSENRRIYYTSESLYNYRYNEQSVTKNISKIYNSKGELVYIDVLDEIRKILPIHQNSINSRKMKTLLETYYQFIIKNNIWNYEIDRYTYNFLEENIQEYLLDKNTLLKFKFISIGFYLLLKFKIKIYFKRRK